MLNYQKILDLDEISINSSNKFGTTLTNLSILKAHEFPILNGFIISTDFFLDLIEVNSIDLNSVDNANIDKLVIPEKTKYEILAKYGDLSGFTDASVNINFILLDKKTGQEEKPLTSFNIKGADNLIAHILNIFVEFCKNYKKEIQEFILGNKYINLLIQKAVIPETSGISYFFNDDIKIEAVFGSYELAIKENIIPDYYILDAERSNLVKEQLISKQEYLFVTVNNEKTINKIKITDTWQQKQKIEKKYLDLIANLTQNTQKLLLDKYKIFWIFEGGKIFIEWIQKNQVSQLTETTYDTKNKLDESIKLNDLEIEIPNKLTNEEHDKTSDQDLNLLMQGKYSTGETVYGYVTFDVQNQGKDKILVLKGDEDIPADLKIGGLIIEESSDILAIKLKEIFNVPVITGAQLATSILKEGEYIKMEGSSGRIYVRSLLKINKQQNSTTSYINESIKEKNVNNEFNDNDISLSNSYKENQQNEQISVNNQQKFDEDTVIYENEKVRIERTPIKFPKIKNINTNNVQLDISKLLNLINEDDQIYKVNPNNLDTNSDKNVVVGTNLDIGQQLESLISFSKKIPTQKALEILEESTDQIKEITNSKEFEFDNNELYLQEKIQEITPKSSLNKSSASKKYINQYIPTVTKVYARLIDDVIEDYFINVDGIIFSSTQEMDTLIELLETNLTKISDKAFFVISPSYELIALKQYFEKINILRKAGYRNINIILPDYRNKKEIIAIKRVLNTIGLKRSNSLEIYANLSRGINVFRISELSDTLVDGVFIDLFRIKMNMLGIEKYTASTRYAEGMKNLVNYIFSNIPNNLKVIIDITGFKDKKNIIKHLSQFSKFRELSCEYINVNIIKKQLSKQEKKNLENQIKKSAKKNKYIY